MLVVAYIGFGNSVCRYHLPYVERRKDIIKVKYIYRRKEDRVGDEERVSYFSFFFDFRVKRDDKTLMLFSSYNIANSLS